VFSTLLSVWNVELQWKKTSWTWYCFCRSSFVVICCSSSSQFGDVQVIENILLESLRRRRRRCLLHFLFIFEMLSESVSRKTLS
jgi:hypothetical protein